MIIRPHFSWTRPPRACSIGRVHEDPDLEFGMKIIEQPGAPNPRRVKIFVAEKGLDIPYEALEINKAEHLTEQFTALNPVQRVPVLVLDDGTAISESVAICRYLEDLNPDPNLFGQSAIERAMLVVRTSFTRGCTSVCYRKRRGFNGHSQSVLLAPSTHSESRTSAPLTTA